MALQIEAIDWTSTKYYKEFQELNIDPGLLTLNEAMQLPCGKKAIQPINDEKVLLYLHLIYCFKKQMLQGANTSLFNPLVSKAHNSECQNLLYPLQMPVK